MKVPEHIAPPKTALRFLRWFCNPELVEDVEGDMSELFALRHTENKRTARLFFFWDVLLLMRPGIMKQLEFNKGQNNIAMFNNYLKIALRNALRYKGYTALNLMGLVVGIASSILVLLWINDEVSINKFHEKGDAIYQVFRNMKQSSGVVSTTPTLPKPLGDLVREEYSEVDQVAWVSGPTNMRLDISEQTTEESGRFVSTEFLNMFSFEYLLGDKNSALKELNAILISRSVAEKYFGLSWREEALGKIITVDEQADVIVSGVFEDIGPESTMRFDWLLSAQVYIGLNDWINDWGNGSFRTYITISDPEKVQAVSDRILMEIKTHTVGNPSAGDEEVIIQKFEDTYLYSKFENGVVAGGRIDYVRIMTFVAIFILVVACINFMNLTTARSSRRSKEIGLRKVMGAPKRSISAQFYFEAILLTILAVVISVFTVLLLLPVFNDLVGKSLSLDFTALNTWYFLIGLTLSVGLLSGSYPALMLSTFSIIESMKGNVKQSSFADYFRKGLVVFQFAISTLLIIGTTVVYKQLNYVLNKDLGLDKENLIAVRMDGDLATRMETYKAELLRIPEVTHVSAAAGTPLNYGRSTSSTEWDGKNPSEGYEVNIMLSDQDFIRTSGMEILAGRDFAQEIQDSTNFIINEVAAKLMGFEDPIGKGLSFWGIEGKIIGVVKNFHMADLYEPIAPLIVTCFDITRSSVALVRVNQSNSETLAAIEKVTTSLNPTFDFEYEYIDQAYAESYNSERTISTLVNIFALIAILISSLGLLGLTSYATEQRSREIGVRKVHGASVFQILVLLSKDYSKLILISFALAIPVGHYVTQGWLANFEFRTTLDPFVFVLAGLIAFVLGVLAVSAKSYQAARVNPVKSLKQE